MIFLNRSIFFILLFVVSSFCSLKAQNKDENLQKQVEILQEQINNMRHVHDQIKKLSDDILWYQRVGDVAFIDKVYIAGPPAKNIKSKTHLSYGNPLKFYCYIFIPRDIKKGRKYPVMILPHGGVHSNLTTYYTHIIKEFIYQQYIVVAPEYRGSTGYGKRYYENIDYGGLEVEDVNTARDYVVDNYPMANKNKIGIAGWSHGGLIALMNIFNYPDDFDVAFAGVPVSDLVMRMGYHDKSYHDLYSADYHIGETVKENLEEYKRRSPVWNAHKLKKPLLIHTNTNDDDVNYIEVEHLIQALKAENKKFEYQVYEEIEGGHSFDRIDTKIGKEIRLKIHKFLAKYLNPPRPIKSVKDMNNAAYWHGLYE